MFEFQMIQARQDELIAAADQHRLAREAMRANRSNRSTKDRGAGESRRSRRGSVRDVLHSVAR
ncbi:hypothetical protein [Streptacidiphilus fuscans]|uniref:Uncharacterized protein n=1 Tax=Streptacidiphilus fuscans TaxID=2789292 RepID=A0A931FCN7_9ACTN|nr:hypothetical protein [Streptacidiphilus fuscans]MBF9067370.1 hypothetical protein [Streptacidiphilus fuscans]